MKGLFPQLSGFSQKRVMVTFQVPGKEGLQTVVMGVPKQSPVSRAHPG